MSHELRANILTCCVFLHKLRVIFIVRVTFYIRVTVYFTSYELLLLPELQVIVYCTSYESFFAFELKVTF